MGEKDVISKEVLKNIARDILIRNQKQTNSIIKV